MNEQYKGVSRQLTPYHRNNTLLPAELEALRASNPVATPIATLRSGLHKSPPTTLDTAVGPNSGCNGGPNTSVWTVPYHNPSYFPAGPVLGTSSDTALPLSTLAYTGYPRLLLYHVRHVRLIDMVVSTCERACTRHCGFLATCLVALETVPWPTDTPRGSRPHLVTMLLTGVSSEWRVAQYRGQQCIQSRLRGPILVSNRIPWIGSNLRAETSR